MPTKAVLVTGDFILDYHIYEGRRHHYGEKLEDGVKVKPQMGGAALVHQLLEVLLEPKKPSGHMWRPFLAVKDVSRNAIAHQLDPADYAYAFWRPYPKEAAPEQQFWRVSQAMGFGAGDADRLAGEWQPAENLPESPEIVVVSEGGMGFREHPDRWRARNLKAAKWILLKTASPVGEGALWKHLAGKHSNKLVVIVAAHELRKTSARLNAGLSWETSVEDLLRELGPHGELKDLLRCRHLIVTFDSEGAFWLDLGARPKKTEAALAGACAHLVYDAGSVEGDHAYAVEGTGFGFLSCLTAALAWQITENPKAPDIAAALEGGLSAKRDLREHGHGPASEAPMGYPAARLAEVIRHPTSSYSRATFACADPGAAGRRPAAQGLARNWTLLSQAQRHQNAAFELARLVLLRGPIALENLPHLGIGNLLTADRSEVEALRTLIQVLRRYQQPGPGGKPLSIGVFGPPGAGKSFAVREIAANLVVKAGWMEFNLAQFNTHADLIGAFHQIRDQVLLGRLPVAFFDEFDAQNYCWLQHLLAPMQDGKFQEGQLTHSLGKCIFVFAGGTSWTFDTFGPPEPGPRSTTESESHRIFRLAKGPDFHSRLDAYLNVSGPNQRHISPPPQGTARAQAVTVGGRRFGPDPADIYFPIRRALMIRADLKCAPDCKLDIDEGLLHALLWVKEYVHGSRSLDKILQPVLAARPGRLHRSSLMPATQLAMHTDAAEFMRLCAQAPQPFSARSPLTMDRIKVIAPAIHETWRALAKKEGRSDANDKPFGQLSEHMQASNRAAALRMMEILDLAGLRLVKGTATAKEEQLVRQHIEYRLEAMAEAEHEGWMAWHLDRGWRPGPVKDEEKRTHPCLRPLRQLKKVESDKDRDSVRHYPEYAREAGLKIDFARDMG